MYNHWMRSYSYVEFMLIRDSSGERFWEPESVFVDYSVSVEDADGNHIVKDKSAKVARVIVKDPKRDAESPFFENLESLASIQDRFDVETDQMGGGL